MRGTRPTTIALFPKGTNKIKGAIDINTDSQIPVQSLMIGPTPAHHRYSSSSGTVAAAHHRH